MSTSSLMPPQDAAVIAANMRRLMAREGLTFDDIVEASALDERTVRGLVHGTNRPHARTLHKLAHGLGVSSDELFCMPTVFPASSFDRATNRLIDEVVAAHPDVFDNWSAADFDELYSRFGIGGSLNEAGILATADAMRRKQVVIQQVGVILESGESELLTDFIELLYRRVTAN